MNTMHQLVTRERLMDCKVPERLTTTITSPSFDWTVTAVRAARDFAESSTTLLAFAGPSGTGKSCAAAIAMALAWRPGRSGEVVLTAEVGTPGAYLYRDNPGMWVVNMPVEGVGAGARRGRWLNTSACSEHVFDDRWWDAARSCGALVIDDLGLELDQRVRDRLLGLIVDRDNDDRRTVLTTNLAANDFRERYCAGAGERLRRRIKRGMWINVVARPLPVQAGADARPPAPRRTRRRRGDSRLPAQPHRLHGARVLGRVERIQRPAPHAEASPQRRTYTVSR